MPKRDETGKFVSSPDSFAPPLPVRLRRLDREKFEAIAAELGESPSVLARRVLTEWLDQQEAAKRPDSKSGGFQQAA